MHAFLKDALPPVALAPMAGVSDGAFRSICLDFGASFCYTEMVSAKALCFESLKTNTLLPIPGEGPVVLQLFGHEPAIISEAVTRLLPILARSEVLALDLNMGCPAPKIFNNGDGCALMRDLRLASKIIEAAVQACPKPVTVKCRTGVDEAHNNAVDFAKMAEGAGAAQLSIHGRHRAQYYAGEAELQSIAAVKAALSIPVFGNGDITDARAAKRMLDETGVDGLLIGRGAMGNPFIFNEIHSFLQTGKARAPITLEARLAVMRRHIERMVLQKGEGTALRQARKHLPHYLKYGRGSAALRRLASMVATMEDVDRLIAQVKCGAEEGLDGQA